MSGTVHTRDESLWNWLRDVNLWNDLGFNLYTVLSVCHMVTISDGKNKSEMGVSTD